MKIAIVGYSGSGKSTLAQVLAQKHNIPVLHLDTVQFLPGWEIRDQGEKEQLVRAFLDSHPQWVIDGNYSKLSYARRLEEADLIILLLFNRFTCLRRAYRRYRQYAHSTRPDMAQGCKEKFDWAFIKWILWEGRTKRKRDQFQQILTQYSHKAVSIKNQEQLNQYLDALK